MFIIPRFHHSVTKEMSKRKDDVLTADIVAFSTYDFKNPEFIISIEDATLVRIKDDPNEIIFDELDFDAELVSVSCSASLLIAIYRTSPWTLHQ